MKNQVKFKFGDRVYFPIQTHKVLKLIENYYESSKEDYPFMFEGDKHTILTELGTFEYGDLLPPIFHATQENYELLSKLYPNVEFEPPTEPKESKKIIEDMLNDGYHGVLCQIAMVDEDDDSIVRCYRYDYALEVLDDKIIFSHHTMHNDELKFVSPFHQKSGMEIVDFIDGKIVLQNGEVVLESGNE